MFDSLIKLKIIVIFYIQAPLYAISIMSILVFEPMTFPARGGKCSNGGIVPNTAFIFRVFVATPRTPSYLCIFSSFYLALNLHIQVVNSPRYSITWNFPSKFLLLIDWLNQWLWKIKRKWFSWTAFHKLGGFQRVELWKNTLVSP